ncbi:MAG: hypothetical protein PHH76_02010 [Methanothrix soehngenii]|jgi:hypothetical protein|uniref:hypothetical protein n=1 Tax=Methanothrix soehngenii TaxID=2223 RepID=UPI0023F10594|nr:hypothetical protein [Methanothrix soehngenii]MDD5256321.1 hypothetical protein [Methanothrix soehngenii]
MSVHIRRYYGSGPSEVDISGGANPIGLKLKTYDGDSTETYLFNATHPVPKPTIGNKHSFTATIALYSDVLGSEIYSDPKIYSGGVPSVPEPNPQGYVPWTGAQIFIADDTDDTYVRATGVTDDSGTEMVAQGLTSSKTDLLATYNAANMKNIGLVGGASSIGPLSSAQRISKFVRLQGTLGTNCSAGSTVPATIYMRYSVTS